MIHILNEYFRISGEAIEKNDGRVDKYIGDGVMAIFDSNNDNKLNCKNALIAAKQISKAVSYTHQTLPPNREV